LRSVLAQLSSDTRVMSELAKLYEKCKPWAASIEEFISLFLSVIKTSGIDNDLPCIFLVVDALDEISDGDQREEFLDFLVKVATRRETRLRILVTSRKGSDIAEILSSNNGWTPLKIAINDVETDIRRYADVQMAKHRILKDQPAEIKSEIADRLSRRSQGM
jgi:hypothetical protein